MNIYLVIILVIIIGEYILNIIMESLNLKCASETLPNEFVGFYDTERYRQSQKYLRENTYFGLLRDTFFTSIIIVFILIGGFNFVDRVARSFGLGFIGTGLAFVGILMLISYIINIPFSAYRTFIIEAKYGFNRTTLKTFILDNVKSLILGAIIGGIVFAGVIWLFHTIGNRAWVWCWIGVSLFQLFLAFIAPILILPLFNKFIPIQEEELKNGIEAYARHQNFKIKGIFKMDASRRSTKSNAFFTGFGKSRRVVLFDTLIQKHTLDELISILAHEIGHYKMKHTLKGMVISILTTGFMFFVLSFFINNPGLFRAFKMEQTSVYASLVFFAILAKPISIILSIVMNALSRRHEYEADAYAVTTYKKPGSFIRALKKLTADNLSNLTPHPLKVFLHYSHPPILKRIETIKRLSIQ
jgi:STE24 endopeptidase